MSSPTSATTLISPTSSMDLSSAPSSRFSAIVFEEDSSDEELILPTFSSNQRSFRTELSRESSFGHASDSDRVVFTGTREANISWAADAEAAESLVAPLSQLALTTPVQPLPVYPKKGADARAGKRARRKARDAQRDIQNPGWREMRAEKAARKAERDAELDLQDPEWREKKKAERAATKAQRAAKKRAEADALAKKAAKKARKAAKKELRDKLLQAERNITSNSIAQANYPSPAPSPALRRPVPTSPTKSPAKKATKDKKHVPATVAAVSGLGERPLVNDVGDEGLSTGAYDEASKYISSVISDPNTDKKPNLTLLHALIVELGFSSTSFPSPLPSSMKAAKTFLKTHAFVNIGQYLSVRTQGQKALQGIIHPTRSSLMKDIGKKRNRVPLGAVKAMGLNVLLVSCYH